MERLNIRLNQPLTHYGKVSIVVDQAGLKSNFQAQKLKVDFAWQSFWQ